MDYHRFDLGDGTAAPIMRLNGAVAARREIRWQTEGTDRWRMLANGQAESGSNAGSNLDIEARDYAGGAIGTALRIIRSTMHATFGGAVSVQSTTAQIHSGTGTPEGAVTASTGSVFLRTDGGANTTLYVKESGTGNTGWVAK